MALENQQLTRREFIGLAYITALVLLLSKLFTKQEVSSPFHPYGLDTRYSKHFAIVTYIHARSLDHGSLACTSTIVE